MLPDICSKWYPHWSDTCKQFLQYNLDNNPFCNLISIFSISRMQIGKGKHQWLFAAGYSVCFMEELIRSKVSDDWGTCHQFSKDISLSYNLWKPTVTTQRFLWQNLIIFQYILEQNIIINRIFGFCKALINRTITVGFVVETFPHVLRIASLCLKFDTALGTMMSRKTSPLLQDLWRIGAVSNRPDST